MSSRKKLTAILGVILIVLVASAFAAKHYIDQKVADNERIVATTDAIAEIFDKLDLNLVGVPTTQAQLPSRYQKTPRIGSPMQPSVEKIASLNPTKVYAVSTLKDQYNESFKEQGVKPIYLQLDSVNQLKSTLKKLGNEYYRQNQAQDQINLIDNAINTVKRRIRKRRVRVLILMGMPGAGYMILTNKSYLGDLVKIAGGENVYQSKSQIYLSPSNESLATKHPDVILRLAHALPKITIPQFKAEFKKNPVFKKMKAVKEKRVYDLEQPVFNASANMEAAQALKEVSNILYPAK